MKKNLPIDIAIVNCLNQDEAIKTLNYCKRFFNFKNSHLFSDLNPYEHENKFIKIKKIENISQYNNFLLKIGDYIESSHVLIVQDDGHIVNPDMWSDDYLIYDYIGAPWPNSYQWNKRWKKYDNKTIVSNSKKNRVGNGGFSLRSKKFLDYSSNFSDCEGFAEDVFLCLVNYQEAISKDIKFAPFEIAKKFSYEVPLGGIFKNKEKKNINFKLDNHFGWHGKRFKNFEELMKLKFTEEEFSSGR